MLKKIHEDHSFIDFPQYNGPYGHTDIAQFLDRAVLSVKTNLLGRDGSFGFNERTWNTIDVF